MTITPKGTLSTPIVLTSRRSLGKGHAAARLVGSGAGGVPGGWRDGGAGKRVSRWEGSPCGPHSVSTGVPVPAGPEAGPWVLPGIVRRDPVESSVCQWPPTHGFGAQFTSGSGLLPGSRQSAAFLPGGLTLQGQPHESGLWHCHPAWHPPVHTAAGREHGYNTVSHPL